MSENSTKKVLHKMLEQEKSKKEFEEIWSRYEMQKSPSRKRIKLKKVLAVVAAVICLGTGAVLSANYTRIQDNIAYRYENDEMVLGSWKVIDLVKKPEQFIPGEVFGMKESYLKQMTFKEDGILELVCESKGKMFSIEDHTRTWTKGHVLDKENMTDSTYTIQDIEGKDYMFYEWKNRDYTRGLDAMPGYYVLERIAFDEAVCVVNQGVIDNIDKVFIDHEVMKGHWETIGFVDEIEQFDPDGKYFDPNGKYDMSDLLLRAMNILDEGKIEVNAGDGMGAAPGLRWTDNMIISKVDQTASLCTIKEIGGQTYMFYEWKSGDYSIRGLDPSYYVLKKVQ
ncbi:MAG: hypothetical protein ACRCW2_11135 [Cellulosilyticaceae bacterium]